MLLLFILLLSLWTVLFITGLMKYLAKFLLEGQRSNLLEFMKVIHYLRAIYIYGFWPMLWWHFGSRRSALMSVRDILIFSFIFMLKRIFIYLFFLKIACIL